MISRRSLPAGGAEGTASPPLEGGIRVLNNITMGQYYPVDSKVHRLDPRIKLILTIAFIVAVFMAKTFLGYALILAFV